MCRKFREFLFLAEKCDSLAFSRSRSISCSKTAISSSPFPFLVPTTFIFIALTCTSSLIILSKCPNYHRILRSSPGILESIATVNISWMYTAFCQKPNHPFWWRQKLCSDGLMQLEEDRTWWSCRLAQGFWPLVASSDFDTQKSHYFGVGIYWV